MTTQEAWAMRLGQSIEIPVYYDLWMRGARFGKIVGYRGAAPSQKADCVLVRMDNPRVRQLVRVWRGDWESCKVI